MERGLWLSSGPAPPRDSPARNPAKVGPPRSAAGPPSVRALGEAAGNDPGLWGSGLEPALKVGGSRSPGRRRGEGPALKQGAQFWGLLRLQLDSQVSRSAQHTRGTTPWAGGAPKTQPRPASFAGPG